MMRRLVAKTAITLLFGLAVYFLTLLRVDAEAFRIVVVGDAPDNPIQKYPLPSKHRPEANSRHDFPQPQNHAFEDQVSIDDVLLIMRTSSSTIWRRLPIYLSTLFTSVSNLVIYSDFAESISGIPVLDAYQNVSDKLKASEDFKKYRIIQDFRNKYPMRYFESTSVEGDWLREASESWALDKYKFLPVLQHAFTTNPGLKWYVMIEDDTVLFWTNLRRHLKGLNHNQPHWLGHFSYRMGQSFAHGGSGMVFSHRALRTLFDDQRDLAAKYEDFTTKHHVGDHVLGHAMNEKNMSVNGDGHFDWHFGDEPTWTMWFGAVNWNQSLFSLHHVHQRDISQLWEFQTKHERLFKRDITYADIFTATVLPMLEAEKNAWDCLAQEQNSVSSGEEPNLEDKAAFSREGCLESCLKWEDCLMWKWDESYGCFRDSHVSLGHPVDQADPSHMTSGWMIDRISKSIAGNVVV